MKYKSIKDLTTPEWGKMAFVGILAGYLSQSAFHMMFGVVWQTLFMLAGLLGWIALAVWIYRKRKKL